MSRLFGTDGIRGKANVYPMSPDFILRLGQALGIYFKARYPHARILIGKDTRRSGYMLEQALCAGICSVGVDALFLGPLPTPGIAYLTRGLRASAGIVISASHNPYYDNGIKIFDYRGCKLGDHIEEEIEALLKTASSTPLPVDEKIGTARRVDDAIGQYAVFLKEQFPKNLTLEGLRIVVDCANGAGYRVAPKVFEELGAEVILLGVEPNGTNINSKCGALHPENISQKVKLYRADLGVALDGDADRLILIDEKGSVVDGDQVLAMCGIDMIQKNQLNKKTVVSTIMSNGGLEVALKKSGGSLIRTKVGDRYVFETMQKENYNLGGEPSGHLIFSDRSTTGDGILAALRVLEVMLESGKPLSELRQCMEPLPQVTTSIDVQKKIPLEKLTELTKVNQSIIAKLGDKGRTNLRYSGTENKLRVMVEGENTSEVRQMAEELCQTAKQEIAKRQSK